MPRHGSHDRPERRECVPGDLFSAPAYTSAMGDDLHLIRFNDTTRQRWRNDGGWTREIAIGGDADDWDWRISVAEVEADGPFSAFPGIEREIVLLAGAGMRFEFDDGEQASLTPESPRLRFDGGRALHSRLIDGPTRDFNLMWRPGRIDAELWVRPLVGDSVLFAEPGETRALHMTSGSALLPDADDVRLDAGDTLLMRAGDARASQRVSATGLAIVARLRVLDAQPVS